MLFLLISQRARGSPGFRLNDTPGHGRFDVIPRVALAALRPVVPDQDDLPELFAFLKGEKPHGWLHMRGDASLLEEDESSLAALWKGDWQRYWTEGSLSDLISSLGSRELTWVELAEDGMPLLEFMDELETTGELALVLGAQQDISEEDREVLSPLGMRAVSLGDTPLLASQAVSLFRLTLQSHQGR